MSNKKIIVSHNGTDYSGEVMTIDSTSLGYQDHGILTAQLHCSTSGGGVSVGGYVLDSANPDRRGERVPTAYGMDYIAKTMATVGVSSWEDLVGEQVIVLSAGSGGWGSQSLGIAGLLNDKVFILKDHVEAWKAASESATPAGA